VRRAGDCLVAEKKEKCQFIIDRCSVQSSIGVMKDRRITGIVIEYCNSGVTLAVISPNSHYF